MKRLLGEEHSGEIDLAQLQQIVALKEPLVKGADPIDPQKESGFTLNVDKAVDTLQKTQTSLLKKYKEGDPRYERIKKMFEGSQRRLELTRRPGLAAGKAKLGTSYTDVLMNVNAMRFNHTHVGPEHLLYGILQLTGDRMRVSQVLNHLQVDRSDLQRALEHHLQEHTYQIADSQLKGNFTDGANEVIEYAYEESHQRRDSFIGAEHLLIGLARHGGDFSGELMQKRGLTAEKIREELALLPDPVSQ